MPWLGGRGLLYGGDVLRTRDRCIKTDIVSWSFGHNGPADYLCDCYINFGRAGGKGMNSTSRLGRDWQYGFVRFFFKNAIET